PVLDRGSRVHINSTHDEFQSGGERPGPAGRSRRPRSPPRDHLRRPGGLGRVPARSERLREDHADAGAGRRPDRPERHGDRPRGARRFARSAAPRRVRDADARRLHRPDRRREPALLRVRPGRTPHRRGPRHRGGRARREPRPGRGNAVGRAAQPHQPRRRAAGRTRGPRAGRADRGPRPGAAPGAVAVVPRPGRPGPHPHRVQPRHGRGGTDRPPPPHARGPHPRRRHAGRPALGHRRVRPGGGVPPPHRGEGREHPMNVSITLATTRRILAQLRHDHRTLALLIGVPALLMILLRYVFDQPMLFDRVGPMLLGLFPFTVMFVVTSVATLRERTSGTLERLMTMPLGKLDLLLGYALAFGLVALVQVGVVLLISLTWLGLDLSGSLGSLVLVALLDALLGMSLGLFASAFARTVFQAVQFMPAFVLPQLLLCGLIMPREEMASWLRVISDVLPLSYAVEGMREISSTPEFSATLALDVVVIAAFTVVSLLLGAVTLRRRTA